MFNELVKIENGRVVTTSLIVATYFEREHYDVIKIIRNIVAESVDVTDNSGGDFSCAKNSFVEGSYIDKQGKPRPMYYLSRDGFMLLVMYFSGKKALEFKWKFIEAFNKMEQQLKYGIEKTPQTYLEALEQLVEKEKQRLILEQKYIDAENRAKENQDVKDLYDATNASEEYWLPMKTVADVLDVIGIGRNNLYKFLREQHVLSQNNEPMRCYQEMGYIRSSYVTGFKNQVICVVSLKGLKFIFKKLQNAELIPRTTQMEEWLKLCTALDSDNVNTPDVVVDNN